MWRSLAAIAIGVLAVGVGLFVYVLVELSKVDGPERAAPLPKPRPATAREIAGFRSTVDPPAYWLGPRFQGMRVTYVDVELEAPSIAYGEPTYVGGDESEGGEWLYPVHVTTITGTDAEVERGRGLGRVRLRGVPAEVCERCDAMELLTGRALVYVERTGDASFRDVARALRSVRRERPDPRPLPPPRG